MTYWVAGSVIVGGLVSANASKSAANTQAGAAGNAQQISQNEFNTITAQEQPFMQSGYGAMNQLNYLLGIGPKSGTISPTFSGGGGRGAPSSAPAASSGGKSLVDSLHPWTGITSKLGTAGKIIDPAVLFGSLTGGHSGSHWRNWDAFNAANPGTTSTPDGNYKLPDGTVVNQKQLDDLAGTWYGAAKAPDGDQSGWQQKYSDVLKGIYGDKPPGGSTGGWTMSPDGSMHQQLQAGGGTPGQGAPEMSSTAGGYGSLLSPFTADTFKEMSPAYQFQLQQGQQGVLNGASSGQGALSGATQKDLMSFNQNLANTSFNNAFNQYQTQQGNIYSRLAGIAQLGQSAAANTGQQGTALAGQAAQSATNVGTAQAAGQVGAANAYSGALSSAIPWLAAGSNNNWAWGGSAPAKAGP